MPDLITESLIKYITFICRQDNLQAYIYIKKQHKFSRRIVHGLSCMQVERQKGKNRFFLQLVVVLGDMQQMSGMRMLIFINGECQLDEVVRGQVIDQSHLEQQINIRGSMEYNKVGSVVLDLNSLQEGLNFLVPRDWWEGFLSLNKRTRSHEDIQIPEAHPLAFLFEIGLVCNCTGEMKNWTRSHEARLKSMEERAQDTGYIVNDLVNQAVIDNPDKDSKKRNRPFCQWWDFNNIFTSKTYNKILLSPFIDTAPLTDLFGAFQWRVVSPRLYKLITQNDCSRRGDLNREIIIGVPIFLSSADIRHSGCEMEYVLGPQVSANLYFYNTMGVKYAFLGAMEVKLNQDQVMRYLFDGLNKMAVMASYPAKCFRNQLRMVNNKIYCNFEDEEQNSAAFKWEPFTRFQGDITHEGLDIIELSSYSRSGVEVDEESVSKKGRKKLKKDEGEGKQEIQIVSRTVKKIPPIKFKDRISRFQKFQHQHPSLYQEIKQSATHPQQELHYSTEEETPSIILEDQQQEVIFQGIEDDRITYPLWKNPQSIQPLIRLGELKLHEAIPLPFSASAKKIIKTRENKRVLISTTANALALNESGEAVEQEEERGVKSVPDDIIRQLQGLALQILGEKRMNLELLIKEEELEAAKEKIDLESRTCKNEEQELDDLDEAESREC